MTSKTKASARIRFRGGNDRAYRFILAIQSRVAPSSSEFVRHRCHNRLCVNPAHLVFGSQRDNWLDEVERRANGTDYHLL